MDAKTKKEELALQKELLSLQVQMGKSIVKSKLIQKMKIAKKAVVDRYIGVYDPEELRDLIDVYIEKLMEELEG